MIIVCPLCRISTVLYKTCMWCDSGRLLSLRLLLSTRTNWLKGVRLLERLRFLWAVWAAFWLTSMGVTRVYFAIYVCARIKTKRHKTTTTTTRKHCHPRPFATADAHANRSVPVTHGHLYSDCWRHCTHVYNHIDHAADWRACVTWISAHYCVCVLGRFPFCVSHRFIQARQKWLRLPSITSLANIQNWYASSKLVFDVIYLKMSPSPVDKSIK